MKHLVASASDQAYTVHVALWSVRIHVYMYVLTRYQFESIADKCDERLQFMCARRSDQGLDYIWSLNMRV